jgi:hypothetical protein
MEKTSGFFKSRTICSAPVSVVAKIRKDRNSLMSRDAPSGESSINWSLSFLYLII